MENEEYIIISDDVKQFKSFASTKVKRKKKKKEKWKIIILIQMDL